MILESRLASGCPNQFVHLSQSLKSKFKIGVFESFEVIQEGFQKKLPFFGPGVVKNRVTLQLPEKTQS